MSTELTEKCTLPRTRAGAGIQAGTNCSTQGPSTERALGKAQDKAQDDTKVGHSMQDSRHNSADHSTWLTRARAHKLAYKTHLRTSTHMHTHMQAQHHWHNHVLGGACVYRRAHRYVFVACTLLQWNSHKHTRTYAHTRSHTDARIGTQARTRPLQ